MPSTATSSTIGHFTNARLVSEVSYEKCIPVTHDDCYRRRRDGDLEFRGVTHRTAHEMLYSGPTEPFLARYRPPLMQRSRHEDPVAEKLYEGVYGSELPAEVTVGPVVGLVTTTTARYCQHIRRARHSPKNAGSFLSSIRAVPMCA